MVQNLAVINAAVLITCKF